MGIAENALRVREQIHEACLKAGRAPGEVTLMAVSKFHETPAITAAADAGLLLFGESRVQEAVRKFTPFRERRPDVSVHLIGGLQRNKAKAAAALFDCVQSVDRDGIVRELGLVARDRAEPLSILFELNAGEAAKSGYADEDALCAGAEVALGFGGLRPAGLMTMAPFTGDERAVREAFRKLTKAQERLRRAFPECCWDCLSMGMSGDFKIAIEEGSTLVRIGTAIFGERQ
ncbi:MAG: YggS family pyridoxal phosphate-dependent enzyme [Spirochaetaceae bacterium]|jgi:pyridoxal phosphate enzyme (YggS family)|nr:YggS family pyridoxal phosphate-dependent enzyme [Spirochaetaceae bacterium]